MNEIIKKLESIKNKPHLHYLCWAGSTICRVSEWGEKKVYDCPHKGKNDWGLLNNKVSACKNCDGEIKGMSDLTDIERWENYGIEKAIEVLKAKP